MDLEKKRIELMERIKQLGQWDREERRWVFSLDLFIEESFMNKRMVHGSLYGRVYNAKEMPYKRCKGKRGMFGL